MCAMWNPFRNSSLSECYAAYVVVKGHGIVSILIPIMYVYACIPRVGAFTLTYWEDGYSDENLLFRQPRFSNHVDLRTRPRIASERQQRIAFLWTISDMWMLSRTRSIPMFHVYSTALREKSRLQCSTGLFKSKAPPPSGFYFYSQQWPYSYPRTAV